MGEVGGGEGIATQQNAVAAQQAERAPISFVDGDGSSDPATAILDEVLAGVEGAAQTEGAPPADGGEQPPAKPAEAAPVTEPAKPTEGATDIEGARLRRGFAKLADDRQKLVEQQNALRAERANVGQFEVKARAHDELKARLLSDPASVIAELGDELINKTLQGFIDREKSPAEREVAKLRADTERDRAERTRQEQERVAAEWRGGIARQVQADERFDLVNTMGLHGDVVDVITGYYEKHSERDDKGNVTVPALLPWDIAAQAVEDREAGKIEKSKRYGKRTPPAETPATTGKPKDAPPAKQTPAPAKRAPTSLSSVPVADGPSREEELPTDDLDERQSRLLAQLGF